jgi:hypothetical protein
MFTFTYALIYYWREYEKYISFFFGSKSGSKKLTTQKIYIRKQGAEKQKQMEGAKPNSIKKDII